MHRRLYWILTSISAVALVASYRVSSQAGGAPPAALAAPPAATSTPSPGSSGSASPHASASGSDPGAGSGSATSSSSLKDGTFTGSAAQTPYGPVQVRITVADGKITQAQAVSYPDSDGRSQQISGYAVPVLNGEAVSAGSAQIDLVSGATYTSRGYAQSLQGALDEAHA